MNVSLGEKLKGYRDLVFGFHGGLQQMSNGSHDRWNRDLGRDEICSCSLT